MPSQLRCVIAIFLMIASCGRPNPSQSSTRDRTDTDETSATTQGVIPVTGGQTTSSDGVFTVAVLPHTFDQTITVTIEKLSENPAGDETSVTSAYRVRYTPTDAALPEDKTVRVQFNIAQQTITDIQLANLRIVSRAEEEADFSTRLEPRTEEGQVWSQSDVMQADFGLIRTDATDACECNADDTCSDDCDCDPDCDDTPDSENPGEPTNCDDGLFACTSGTQCIPSVYVCDGTAQCTDESDESVSQCGGDNTGGSASDVFEPDNTFAQASRIAPGDSQTRSLPLGDADIVLFEITERRDVTITADAGMMAIVSLQLYNEAQEEIAYSRSDELEQVLPLHTVIDAGTYYIYAGEANGRAIGSYTLSLVVIPPRAPGPENLTGELLNQAVSLNWDAPEGAASYRVHYGEYSGGPYLSEYLIAEQGRSPINTNSANTGFALTGFPIYWDVFVVVTALTEDGEETYPSNEVHINIGLTEDAYEPDDSMGQATELSESPIESGTYRQSHSAHMDSDVDYVMFELAAFRSNVSIVTSGNEYSDTELFLYDSGGQQIAYNNDGSFEDLYARISSQDLSAGVYYVMARPNGGWGTYGLYYLDITIEAQSASVSPDSHENDNTFEDVADSDAHILENNQPQTHTIHSANDIDFARFTLAESSNVVLTTTGAAGDTVLRVYGADRQQIAIDDTTGQLSRVELQELRPGSYYVSVTSQGSPALIQSYDLTLRVYAQPEAPTNVRVIPGPGLLTVTWDVVEAVTGYLVYYAYSNEPLGETVSATEGASPLAVSTTYSVLTGLPTEAHTSICIKAVNGTAQSACSSTIDNTPLPPNR